MNRVLRVLRELRPSRLREVIEARRVLARPWRDTLIYLGLRPVSAAGGEMRFRGGGRLEIERWDDLVTAWGCWVRQDYPVRGDERVILDAGANVGAFSLYAATRAPGAHIHAIEPGTAALAGLRRMVEHNGLAGRITIHGWGIAGTSGERTIYESENTVYSTIYEVAGRQPHTIAVKSLADAVREAGNPDRIDLLKMDCEGAEMEALLAAPRETLARIRRVAIEFHALGGFRIEDVTAHLAGAGLALTACVRHPAYASGFARYDRGVHA